MGLSPEGRELLVVVVKGTFQILSRKNDTDPVPSSEQVPITESDVFSGEAGLSAPLYESDFAPHKPRCDVLLNGSAYAPGGKPARKVHVRLQLGAVDKSIEVTGDRKWWKWFLWLGTSRPRPFLSMPISYNNAFGGRDTSHKKEGKHRTYLTNHVGVGFHANLARKAIQGAPLPNTQAPGVRVMNPKGKYRPMAFGPIGRAWHPRAALAGTYDDNWLQNVCPFLPGDFQEVYYQTAPSDQQIPYPKGGERVTLSNLTPEGLRRFLIPRVEMPIVFFRNDGSREDAEGAIDTVVIEPDAERLMLTWRSTLPLRRNMFEIAQVVVGRMSPGWHRAREMGKTHYRSLAETVGSPTLVRPAVEDGE